MIGVDDFLNCTWFTSASDSASAGVSPWYLIWCISLVMYVVTVASEYLLHLVGVHLSSSSPGKVLRESSPKLFDYVDNVCCSELDC